MPNKSKFIILASILLFSILSASIVNAQDSQNCSLECANKVCVTYFYSPNCHACQSIKDFMAQLESNYSSKTIFHRLDVTNSTNFEKYSQLCTIQNLSMENRGIPLVITQDSFLMGTGQIKDNLEKDIQKLIAENKTGCIDPNICQSTTPVSNNTSSQNVITLPLIIVAAAADSINPCAIGVLIFLLGFLLLSSGRNHARTIKIALIYIATVYIAYLLAGIGILAVLSKLTFMKTLTKIIAVGIGIMGLINIKDALQKKEEGTLAIPAATKPLIERWVNRASVPAAIVLGIIVASVELPCTGGMYLAILTLMSNTVTRNTAISYLLFYNFIFVLPLLLLTLFFVKGFEAEKMQSYLDQHKTKARMIMGIVLLGISIILLFV